MKKVPTAIMMSGTGSNAIKIIEDASPNLDIRVILSDNPESRAEEIAKKYGINYELNNIYAYFDITNQPGKLDAADREKLKDKGRRKEYDIETYVRLCNHKIELIAAAGYDWVIDPFLCSNFIIGNVHPGYLPKKLPNGKPMYAGLAWIPTAKAILNGEKYVYTSTHLITPGLDEGPVARISSPVPINLPEGITKDNILGGTPLKYVISDINSNEGRNFGQHLIYTHSKKIQNKLKEKGDWVEFPLTMHLLGEYMINERFSRGEAKELLLDGKPIPDLFLMDVK
jgi:folate-dependent phosphoribosylglycinamide formyltransferase PurN